MAAALTSLLRSASITDHDQVLSAAAAAAKSSPSNVLAQRTRIVALLKLDRFADALAVLADAPAAVADACLAEKVYALYKTGQLDDATALLAARSLDQADGDDGDRERKTALAHLNAQVSYRAGRFADAFSAYKTLLAATTGAASASAERNDVVINLAAAAAQLDLQGGGAGPAWNRPLPDPASEGSFEACFNHACECVARGDFARAELFLARALGMCNDAEDLTDEERESERMPILVQIAYVQARLGKTEDALYTLQPVLDSKSLPDDLRPIAQTNRIVASNSQEKTKNAYLVQHDIQSLTIPSTGLAAFQTQALSRNVLAADLAAHKTSGIPPRVEKRLSAFLRPTTAPAAAHLSIMDAAARIHAATTPGQKITLIEGLIAKRPQDLGLVLALVQLRIDAGQHGHALRDLRAFLRRAESDSVQFAPGLLSLVTALHRHLGHEPLLRFELARVLAHCLKNNNNNTSPRFLQEAAVELLQSPTPGHLAVASAAFEALCAADPQGTNAIAEAGLVAACATTDYPKAEPRLANLPPVASLTKTINVAALINDGVATLLKSSSAPTTTTTAPSKKRPAPTTATTTDSPKRPRKLPKNFEEGKTPDPERWLPLRDRSSYRPKGRKGKKKAAETTQGGVVKDDHGLDAGARAQAQGQGQGQVLMQQGQGGGGAGRRKKKGKK